MDKHSLRYENPEIPEARCAGRTDCQGQELLDSKAFVNLCADDARIACPLFQAEYGGSKPTSALHLRFAATSEAVFKTLNSAWHSRLPQIGNSHFRVCYVADCANVIYAVAAWSNPVARFLPQREWLELRRFAIAPDAPRFTASRMLGWMRRDIVSRFPEVTRLISYQDLEVHKGTIYKASGWKQAENFTPRARGWIGWGTRPRKGRTNQAVAPRMRWEYEMSPK
jgi:hypothetical protein